MEASLEEKMSQQSPVAVTNIGRVHPSLGGYGRLLLLPGGQPQLVQLDQPEDVITFLWPDGSLGEDVLINLRGRPGHGQHLPADVHRGEFTDTNLGKEVYRR